MVCTYTADKGYWKPCYGKGSGGTGESYKGEILGYMLDRIAGFYHTCAVGAYHFQRNNMLTLASTLAQVRGGAATTIDTARHSTAMERDCVLSTKRRRLKAAEKLMGDVER